MKKIVSVILSFVLISAGFAVSAADGSFIKEFVSDDNYKDEITYEKYSEIEKAGTVVGFYKCTSALADSAEKCSYIAFYEDGTVFVTINSRQFILNFGGTYKTADGAVSVTIDNTNNYYGISKLIAEPLSFSITSQSTLLYTGRDYAVSPKNGETYTLVSGAGFRIVTVKYNGTLLEFDQQPVIISGRTMVPIRAVTEAMGCTVTWKSETKTANIKNDDKAIALQVGNSLMSVLDKKTDETSVVTLDSEPVILNDRLLLPIRAVCEVFGATVGWNNDTGCVTIEYKNQNANVSDTPDKTPDAETEPPETVYTTVYIKQRSEESCTLASVAMLLRSKAEKQGKDFTKITEARLMPFAWQEGVGLKSSFVFETDTVSAYKPENGEFSALSAEDKKAGLIKLLGAHPEGVAAYDYETPHAIWLSSYDRATDTFYMADPSKGVAEGILTLDKASINGETAADKLAAIDKIWCIAELSD